MIHGIQITYLVPSLRRDYTSLRIFSLSSFASVYFTLRLEYGQDSTLTPPLDTVFQRYDG